MKNGENGFMYPTTNIQDKLECLTIFEKPRRESVEKHKSEKETDSSNINMNY